VLAADLVARKVDVIITNGTPGTLAAKNATSTIPIVFTGAGDPVGVGLVASLARPGGNLTGFTNISAGLTPKLLDLLTELVPGASRIGLLVNPNNPAADLLIQSLRKAAHAKGVTLDRRKASTEGEIDDAFASLVQLRAGALIVAGDPFLSERPRQITALASRDAVPAIYGWIGYVAFGALMVYGVDEDDQLHQAGIYAGRILNGARPADLPVQQPTTFKLIVNLKAANALGLTVPQSIITRADEVIE
jgi:putative ABC transport system substrate-binding protein